nr:MAG TPA: hypothetical protein [Herelleviridae sp.]
MSSIASPRQKCGLWLCALCSSSVGASYLHSDQERRAASHTCQHQAKTKKYNLRHHR